MSESTSNFIPPLGSNIYFEIFAIFPVKKSQCYYQQGRRVTFDILFRESFSENCAWIRALFGIGTENGRAQKTGPEAPDRQELCPASARQVAPPQSRTTWCSFSESVTTTPSVCFWKTLFRSPFTNSYLLLLDVFSCLLSDWLITFSTFQSSAGYPWETVESIPTPALTVLHLECSGRGGCGAFGARGGAGSGDFCGYLYFAISESVPFSFRRWGEGGVLITPFKFVSNFSGRGHAPCPPCLWQNAKESEHGHGQHLTQVCSREVPSKCLQIRWVRVGAGPMYSKNLLVNDRGLGRGSWDMLAGSPLASPSLSFLLCTIGSWEKLSPGFWAWLTMCSVSSCTQYFWILEKLQWYRKIKWVTFFSKSGGGYFHLEKLRKALYSFWEWPLGRGPFGFLINSLSSCLSISLITH